MQIITKQEFERNKDEFLSEVKKGAVFIHPTDTIYGLGCDATNAIAIDRLRRIKNRSTRPFSVIAPSKAWIFNYCSVPIEAEKWLDKLPGPYTLVFKLKHNGRSMLPSNLTMGLDSIGVRIPDHWFSDIVSELNAPVVTTSANISGNDFMTDLDSLEQSIKRKVKFVIFEGKKDNRPSTMVHLDENNEIILPRDK